MNKQLPNRDDLFSRLSALQLEIDELRAGNYDGTVNYLLECSKTLYDAAKVLIAARDRKPEASAATSESKEANDG